MIYYILILCLYLPSQDVSIDTNLKFKTIKDCYAVGQDLLYKHGIEVRQSYTSGERKFGFYECIKQEKF